MTYNHSFAILKNGKSKFLSLSGGQQKMVAMGRGLMSNPKLCIIDEPSCGLTPNVVSLVSEMFSVIENLLSEGIAISMV